MSMEPTTTGAAAGAAGLKMLGGTAGATAGALGLGAAIASIIVMLMTPPRSPREWAVGLISTVMGSIGGGATVIQHYGLQEWMQSFAGLLAVLGIAFACGVPAWAIVRWTFTFIQNRQDRDISQIAEEFKKQIGG